MAGHHPFRARVAGEDRTWDPAGVAYDLVQSQVVDDRCADGFECIRREMHAARGEIRRN